ncbi:hypothetical protein Ancab_029323 [Ancistrocladus abbreviatus]
MEMKMKSTSRLKQRANRGMKMKNRWQAFESNADVELDCSFISPNSLVSHRR